MPSLHACKFLSISLSVFPPICLYILELFAGVYSVSFCITILAFHVFRLSALQEYVQKLGACLPDAKDEGGGLVTLNMNKWAAESPSLMSSDPLLDTTHFISSVPSVPCRSMYRS